MPKPFDAALKHLIQHYPADWLRVLGLPAAAVELLDADLSTVTTEADKVLRIHDSEPWLLHIELQSARDLELGQRLLQYNVLLTSRHGLPVHSAVMLLRPAADAPPATGVVEGHLPCQESYLVFRYQVLRVWEVPTETFLAGGMGTLPLAPLAAVERRELPGVIRKMEDRLGGADSTEASFLWTASYILAGLRYPRELVQSLFAGVRAMKESSTYQAILEEGVTKGRSEGRTEEARRILLRIGTRHLGRPDARTAAALQAIGDLDRLEALTERLLEVSTWQELLGAAAPPPRRRNGKKRK